MVETYDQRRTLLKYRYPERRASGRRKYEKIEVKALEDLEWQSDFSRRMRAAKKKIQTTYGMNTEEVESKQNKNNDSSPSRTPASMSESGASNSALSEGSGSSVKYLNTIRLIDETPILKR